jgi:putative multiple sugar transport system permease protein
MLICILTGGNIDLSVGSGVALVSAVAGVLIVDQGVNIYISMIICIALGSAMGLLQGYFIAYLRVPAFIVTLAGMLTFRGLANIILNGVTVSPYPNEYLRIFGSFIPGRDSSPSDKVFVDLAMGALICLGIIALQIYYRKKSIEKNYPIELPAVMAAKLIIGAAVIMTGLYILSQNKGVPIILLEIAIIVIVYNYFTKNTVQGRYFYAVGGNEAATKFSGINTSRTILLAYANMGFLVAIASLICVARFNASAPAAGEGYELDAIGACFIGGASTYGGSGTVLGAVIGAVFMGVLNNGKTIIGIDANWQKAIKGVALLAAVVFDIIYQRKMDKTAAF